MLVLIWVLTGHWLLMDGPSASHTYTHTHTRLRPRLPLTRVLLSAALAMGLCVAMIAFVRLPSLKVSCLLLSGLLIYDVFWVRPGPARFLHLKEPLSTPPQLHSSAGRKKTC